MTDLLARRRAETTEVIHRAALDLFETQGVRGTTVPQIAERAGVSPRTFFRYFRAKEDAAMPGRDRLLEAVDTIDVATLPPAGILSALADGIEAIVRADTDPGLVEHERISRLMVREPELQWHAAARDREFADHVVAHVGADPAHIDAVTAALLAELAVMLWRVTWDLWGRQSQDVAALAPAEVVARLRAALPTLV